MSEEEEEVAEDMAEDCDIVWNVESLSQEAQDLGEKEEQDQLREIRKTLIIKFCRRD